ncbi:MAG: hypothetical protein R3C44_10935 [Chloroflexota bacterium]
MNERNRTADDLRNAGMAVGTGKEIVDQLGAWEAAGVRRIMLQWLTWTIWMVWKRWLLLSCRRLPDGTCRFETKGGS